jgi:hypothetical protein
MTEFSLRQDKLANRDWLLRASEAQVLAKLHSARATMFRNGFLGLAAWAWAWAASRAGMWRAEAILDSQLRALDPAPVDPTHSPPEARVKLGGDPRGRCASLLLPGVFGDGWGDGFSIF